MHDPGANFGGARHALEAGAGWRGEIGAFFVKVEGCCGRACTAHADSNTAGVVIPVAANTGKLCC